MNTDNYKPANRPIRSSESIKKRVKLILKYCISFGGCVAKIIRSNPNGTNKNDHIHRAIALYNEKIVSSALDDVGPDFKYLLAFGELRKNPKFMTQIDVGVRIQTDSESSGGSVKITSEDESGNMHDKTPVERLKKAYRTAQCEGAQCT